jgi:GGDEF domain-containing protein
MQHVTILGRRRLAPPVDPTLIAGGADPETGLLDRESLLQVLGARIAEIGRHTFGFALLVLDATPLAAASGPGGGALLGAIAGRLRRQVRSADVAAQLAAGRFAVLSPGAMTLGEAESFAGRLGAELRAGAVAGDWLVGIALYPDDAWEGGTLLRRAEGTLRPAPTPHGWHPPPRPGRQSAWEPPLGLTLHPIG